MWKRADFLRKINPTPKPVLSVPTWRSLSRSTVSSCGSLKNTERIVRGTGSAIGGVQRVKHSTTGQKRTEY